MASYSPLHYISDSSGRNIVENGPIMNDVADDMRSAKLYMPKREDSLASRKINLPLMISGSLQYQH
jgi:hypothetical protein